MVSGTEIFSVILTMAHVSVRKTSLEEVATSVLMDFSISLIANLVDAIIVEQLWKFAIKTMR